MDPADDPDDILRANRSREKQFVFDCTFDGNATQQDVYESTTKFLIQNVTNGYNATVFAYGATGAGKTYTMLGTDKEPGIMVQALNDLFLEMARGSNDLAYKVTMSYLEIYNEMIRDLLNPSLGFLELREDAKGNVQVAGISEVTARSTNEVMQMLVKGNRERTQESTAANAASSRSHAILQVTVKQRNRVRNIMQEVRTGKLFLIDLAGSERAANTHNRGKRMVEGAHINRSLLALGNCINALSDKSGPRYINYRDSKLTRLLKDALGGNCKTVMIAHISPASTQFEESRNTLVYADRAKHIKTKVRRNVTDVAYHIAQYTNIIAELREEIMHLRGRIQEQAGTRGNGVANIQAVHSEVLDSRLGEDRAELNRYKEQLLTSFKDQMELRRTLMELSNASMEVSLETSRNQHLISEWEAHKARRRGDLSPVDSDNRYLEDEKALELTGGDGMSEAQEVRVARDELKVLHEEKHKTERVITTVQKELETAQNKTRKLAEMIPMRVSGADQQEIVRLLCRVHQLEIENLESQSASLLRDFQIKKKDMVISRLRHYRNITDDIIRRQRDLLDENSIHIPKDLEDLYELYRLEREERLRIGEDSGNMSPLPKPLAGLHYYPTIEGPGEDGDKVFTQSAKSRHFRRSQVLSRVWKNDSPDNEQVDVMAPSRQSKTSFEDPEVIMSNTRSIAALAAKKRTQATVVNQLPEKPYVPTHRPLYRPAGETLDDFAPVLTSSRLAQHNRLTGDGMFTETLVLSDDNLSQNTLEKTSVHTDGSLPPLVGSDARYRNKKGEPADGSKKGGYTQKLARNQNKKGGGKNVRRNRGQDNRLQTENTRVRAPSPGARRGNVRPRYRNQANGMISDSSAVSTPQNNGSKTHRKALPTIPQYRKGDIAVTGHGLPK